MVDLLFHRNKVDSEVFNTAVQRYIRDPEKNEAQSAKGGHSDMLPFR